MNIGLKNKAKKSKRNQDQYPVQGRIQKIQNEGAEFPTPHPPRKENLTFQGMQHTHCERIRDVKLSNVNISEDRIKRAFIKQFSKQTRNWYFENRRKKGATAPSAPPPGPSPKTA